MLRKLARKTDVRAEKERWFASLDAAKNLDISSKQTGLRTVCFFASPAGVLPTSRAQGSGLLSGRCGQVGDSGVGGRGGWGDLAWGREGLRDGSTTGQPQFILEQVNYRHFHMFLVDWALLVQGQSPYEHVVRFEDTLNDVFSKEGQGFQVASHALHDERLFEALKIVSPIRC